MRQLLLLPSCNIPISHRHVATLLVVPVDRELSRDPACRASRRSVLVLFLLSMGKSKTTSKWSHARFYFSYPTLSYPTQRSTHDRQHRPRPTVYNWQYQACTHMQSRTRTLNMLHVQSTCVRCTRVYLEDSFMSCVQFSLMQCVALRAFATSFIRSTISAPKQELVNYMSCMLYALLASLPSLWLLLCYTSYRFSVC